MLSDIFIDIQKNKKEWLKSKEGNEFEDRFEASLKRYGFNRRIASDKEIKYILSSVKNDILYYVIYASIVCTLRKKEITFTDLINFNLELLNNDIISKCIDIVYEKYSEQGNSSRVAKSPKFIFRIDKAIEQNNYL